MAKLAEKLIIPFIIAVISIAATFLITNHFEKRARLGYQLLSKTSLIEIKPDIRNKIKVFYEDKETDKIYSFKVRVVNYGNVALRNQKISFQFDAAAQIISDSFVTKPAEGFEEIFHTEGGVQSNKREYVISLLNPLKLGDEIVWNFITINNNSDYIKVSARGEGLEFNLFDPITKNEEVLSGLKGLTVLIAFILGLCLGYMKQAYRTGKKKFSKKFWALLLISGVLEFILLIYLFQ